jgi:hypothetical protein
MRDNRDIIQKLDWLANDMEDMEVPGEWLLPVTQARSIIFGLREEIEKLKAIVTPKPLDDKAPKDRTLIGVERPPYEDKTYYDMIQWREDQQEWMVEAGIDWSVSPGKLVWAHSGVSHYLDPLELPGLPYWEGKDEEDEGNDP